MKTFKILAATRYAIAASVVTLAASLALMPAPALAYDFKSTTAVNVDANGVILRNFDATTYGPDAAPQTGVAEHTATVNGAVWRTEASNVRCVSAPNWDRKPKDA